MQVAHVAGQEEADDLPPSVAHLVEARDQSLDYQAGVLGGVARRDEVAVGQRLVGTGL